MEIYLDDFTIYGDTFEEALNNIVKVLIMCKETKLTLSNERFLMLLTKGIVLGHMYLLKG